MLTIHLDIKNNTPLYDQIYTHIKSEIESQRLAPGTRLPSSRKLAEHLQVSRNTIDLAYHQLMSEGYIESRPKSGYFVCDVSDFAHFHEITPPKATITSLKKKSYPYDFSPFSVDIDHFPNTIWGKLAKEIIRDDKNLFLLGNRQGDENFRKAISQYLHESRGVNCSKDQIIVGAGADYLLQLLAQLLSSTSKLAFENPTYKQAYMIMKGFHIKTIPIPLDSRGMNLSKLRDSGANICYVTPSHQYPVGIIMPVKRRLELLTWANESEDRYIIEDDHDSEFRYKGKPIPALFGMDTQEKVIYLGTFSRAIAPAIRIGYMVLPYQFIKRYQKTFSYYASTVSRVDQAILTSFIVEGYFEKHLNRMRKIYKSKHDALLNALKIFQNEVHIHSEYAGLHLLVQFHLPMTEETLLKKASMSGIKLYSLKEHFIQPIAYDGIYLLIGFANMSEEQIYAGIKALYDCLHKDS